MLTITLICLLQTVPGSSSSPAVRNGVQTAITTAIAETLKALPFLRKVTNIQVDTMSARLHARGLGLGDTPFTTIPVQGGAIDLNAVLCPGCEVADPGVVVVARSAHSPAPGEFTLVVEVRYSNRATDRRLSGFREYSVTMRLVGNNYALQSVRLGRVS